MPAQLRASKRQKLSSSCKHTEQACLKLASSQSDCAFLQHVTEKQTCREKFALIATCFYTRRAVLVNASCSCNAKACNQPSVQSAVLAPSSNSSERDWLNPLDAPRELQRALLCCSQRYAGDDCATQISLARLLSVRAMHRTELEKL